MEVEEIEVSKLYKNDQYVCIPGTKQGKYLMLKMGKDKVMGFNFDKEFHNATWFQDVVIKDKRITLGFFPWKPHTVGLSKKDKSYCRNCNKETAHGVYFCNEECKKVYWDNKNVDHSKRDMSKNDIEQLKERIKDNLRIRNEQRQAKKKFKPRQEVLYD